MTFPAIRPALLERFKCLGAECEDTCCKGWDMQVDTVTQKRYLAAGAELAGSLAQKDDHFIMRRDPGSSYCVKFEDGVCGIQRNYGEDYLGDACFFYPRAVRGLGDETFVTATLSCPEIARLALFTGDAFALSETRISRRPESLNNYLLPGLASEQAVAIHQQFIAMALDNNTSAERNLLRIFNVAEAFTKTDASDWPKRITQYIENADKDFPPPEAHDTDPVYLLQALCGLVAAAKNVRPARLMQTIEEMEKAVHVTIPWDSLMIAALPDSAHAVQSLHQRWQDEWQPSFTQVLKHYLAAQLSLAFFPFAGFGNTLTQRIAIIGIRLATVKLALMSACHASPLPLTENETVRVIQSISRFLDHLAEPEFSIKIYQETGWLQKRRLRALLGET